MLLLTKHDPEENDVYYCQEFQDYLALGVVCRGNFGDVIS